MVVRICVVRGHIGFACDTSQCRSSREQGDRGMVLLSARSSPIHSEDTTMKLKIRTNVRAGEGETLDSVPY